MVKDACDSSLCYFGMGTTKGIPDSPLFYVIPWFGQRAPRGAAEHRLAVVEAAIVALKEEIELRERLMTFDYALGDANLNEKERQEKEELIIELLRRYPEVDSEEPRWNVRVWEKKRWLLRWREIGIFELESRDS